MPLQISGSSDIRQVDALLVAVNGSYRSVPVILVDPDQTIMWANEAALEAKVLRLPLTRKGDATGAKGMPLSWRKLAKTDISRGRRGVVPSKPSLNVSLTPHLEQFITSLLASGRYQSASEVVRAGLRLLEQSELPASSADATPSNSGATFPDKPAGMSAQPVGSGSGSRRRRAG